jgi:hypothetical protein
MARMTSSLHSWTILLRQINAMTQRCMLPPCTCGTRARPAPSSSVHRGPRAAPLRNRLTCSAAPHAHAAGIASLAQARHTPCAAQLLDSSPQARQQRVE